MSDLPGQQPEPLDDEIEVDLETEALEDLETEALEDGADEADQGGEGDGGLGDEGQAPPARDVAPARRGSPRVQALANENRELKTRVSAFEQQLRDIVARERQPSAAELAAQQAAERERFEMMSPYEQHLYTEQKINERVAQQTNQVAHNLWDQNDRREYEGLLEGNPNYRRVEARVEELKRLAPAVSRRILLATALGERVMAQSGPARARATRNGEAAAARHTTRPSGGGRGDVAPARDRQGDNLTDRLRNQQI